MADWMRQYDLDAWATARLGIKNADGGRGWSQGVRIVSCPLCDDAALDRGRGWINVQRGTAGCFNAGCDAEGGIAAIEYVRRVEGLPTKAHARLMLLHEFPLLGAASLPAPQAAAYDDWCRLPDGLLLVPKAWNRSLLLDEVRAFAKRQWGLSAWDLYQWCCGVCTTGRYAWRIVIPIMMNRKLVGFQARSIRGDDGTKYLTSRHGARDDALAECGRPAEAMLFNIDAVVEGDDVILVEGAGDAMAIAKAESGGRSGDAGGEAGCGAATGNSFEQSEQSPDFHGTVPVALLGLAFTDEKAAILAAKKPKRVIVAADAEPAAEARGRAIVEQLVLQWSTRAVLGHWVGAKDAGAGAQLVVEREPHGLVDLLAARMRR